MIKKKDTRLKKIYKIEVANICLVSFFCMIILLSTKGIKYLFSNILDIHLYLKLDIDFLTVYCGFLSILLPVAILIAERIRDKHDTLISETYLHNTYIFPIIIYFSVNLFLFSLFSDQYFFIITCLISTFMIIFLYYKSFMMVSNHFYEQAEINIVKEDIIKRDLIEQILPFDNENLISNYKKYGIFVKQYDFIPISEYEKFPLYPDSDYQIIKNYNYKVLNKIVPILKKINKEYILSFESPSNKDEINLTVKPNIILVFDALGTTIHRKDCWIYIYYKKKFKAKINKIVKILNDKVYKLSDYNHHLYIEKANQSIALNCIKSINEGSSSMFSDALDSFLDNYKIYIDELVDKVGMYSYEVSYNHVNSIYRIKTYDFLRNIQKNIFDFSTIIVEKNNDKLMNDLISFLYEMMLYSNSKKELLSLQYLYNMYQYLNSYALKLSSNSSIRKIKLEIFEFLNALKYDYKTNNSSFTHDALLICNKTIGNIIYDLRSDDELLFIYYQKLFDYIKDIKDEMNSISINSSEKNEQYYNNIKDIYINFSCNLFAISAYLLKFFEKEKSGEQTMKFLDMIFKNSDNEITSVLLNTIDMEYNNRIYSWDTMEIRDTFDNDGVYTINTVDYLIHLYSKIITSKNKRHLRIKSSYQLSNYVDRITDELEKINKKEYIELFDNVKSDVEEEEKKYLRTTNISEKKVENFKNKFLEEYNKNSNIMNLFKYTNNFRVVERKKTGVNFIGISNIVDKTYFLDKTPNNRYIVWTNFEESFAYSFREAEESKFVESLIKKSKYINCSILDYLSNLSVYKLKKSILFSNYDTIYNLFDTDKINYLVKENDFANLYIMVKEVMIPVCIVNKLEEGHLYHSYTNKIGKFEKSKNGFKIEIGDFTNDENLLLDCMKKRINGLNLEGEDKKNHLLESVDLFIEEYVVYNDDELEVYKFNH